MVGQGEKMARYVSPEVPALVEPRIIRGELPAPKQGGPKDVGKSPFVRHREIAMQFPPTYNELTGEYSGGWIECGRAQRKGDGPKTRNKIILNLKTRLNRWLCVYHPLERYEIAMRTEDPGPSVALYFRFLGTVSEQQHEIDLKKKRANYDYMMRRRDEKRAQRALESRRQEAAEG